MEQIKDHEFCLRCGRKLKNPIARKKGYGTICERKLRRETDHPLFDAKVRSASSSASSSASASSSPPPSPSPSSPSPALYHVNVVK